MTPWNRPPDRTPAACGVVTFRMPALLARRVFRRRTGLPTPCAYCRTSTASQHRHGHSAAEAPIAVGPHVTTDAGVAISEAMPYFRPYSPITLLCTGLENAKALSGLPWWGVVVGATLAARVLLVPIAVYTMKNGARVAQMKPEMDAVQARLRSEQQSDPGARRTHRVAVSCCNFCDVAQRHRRGSSGTQRP
jgi:hypothetical protein|eukprot:COSAG01_NODE_1231_length_11111_cov_37.001816_5_plen_192_part_00